MLMQPSNANTLTFSYRKPKFTLQNKLNESGKPLSTQEFVQEDNGKDAASTQHRHRPTQQCDLTVADTGNNKPTLGRQSDVISDVIETEVQTSKPLLKRQNGANEAEILISKPPLERQNGANETELFISKPPLERQNGANEADGANEAEILISKPPLERQNGVNEAEILISKPPLQRQNGANEAELLISKPLLKRQNGANEAEILISKSPLERQNGANEAEILISKPTLQRQNGANDAEILISKPPLERQKGANEAEILISKPPLERQNGANEAEVHTSKPQLERQFGVKEAEMTFSRPPSEKRKYVIDETGAMHENTILGEITNSNNNRNKDLENKRIRDNIKLHFVEFVQNLEAEQMADTLYSWGIISNEFFQTICSETTRENKCRTLLEILLTISHPTACIHFKKALSKWKTSLLEYVECPLKPNGTTGLLSKLSFEEQEIIFRNLRSTITNSVHPDSVLDVLVGRSIVSCSQYSAVRWAGHRTQQWATLWKYLELQRHPMTFVLLRNIFAGESSYSFIANRIDKNLTHTL